MAEFSYTYYPGGRVASETSTTSSGRETTEYAYDLAGRLDRVTLPDGRSIHYRYDAMGNRLQRSGPEGTTSYAYNRWDQIQRAGDTTFGHDAAGNLAWSRGPAGMTRYSYGPGNRLQGVASPSGSVRYSFDGEGRLLARQAGGQRSDFLTVPVGGQNRIVVQAEGGSLARHYIYGERLLYGGGAGHSEFYLEDRMGSVRLVTDQNQSVLRCQQFTPFGETSGSGASDRFAPAFAGQFFDYQARLVPASLRAYQPQFGRFLQPRQDLAGPSPLAFMPNWGQGPFADRAFSNFTVDLSPMDNVSGGAVRTIGRSFIGLGLNLAAQGAGTAFSLLNAANTFRGLYIGGETGYNAAAGAVPHVAAAIEALAGPLNKPFEHWSGPFATYRSDGFSQSYTHGTREYIETNEIRSHLDRYGYEPGATSRTQTWRTYGVTTVERSIPHKIDSQGKMSVLLRAPDGTSRWEQVPAHVAPDQVISWRDGRQRVFGNQVAIANAMRTQLGSEGTEQLWGSISALGTPRSSAEPAEKKGTEPVGQRLPQPGDGRLRGQDWSDANAASVLDVLEKGLRTGIVSYDSLTPSENRDVGRLYEQNRQKGDDKNVALLGALATITVQRAVRENPWRAMRGGKYLSWAEEAMAKGEEGKARLLCTMAAIEYALFEVALGSQTRAAANLMTSSSSGGQRSQRSVGTRVVGGRQPSDQIGRESAAQGRGAACDQRPSEKGG